MSRKKYQKKCEICGIEFWGGLSKKCCSPKCSSICRWNKRGKKNQYEEIEFNGMVFRRRLPNGRYYFGKRGYGLHRAVWEFHNGPIPSGNHVHHKNENTLDNRIENLECLTPKEHAQRHPDHTWEGMEEHLENIRGKAAEWHSSEEGREWHRQHGKDCWKDRIPKKYVCQECGKEFESLCPGNAYGIKFCSTICAERARYKSGRRKKEQICKQCGKTYMGSNKS